MVSNPACGTGSNYGELLLARNRPQEVAERSDYMGLRDGSPLCNALAELSESKALLCSSTPIASPKFLTPLLKTNSEDYIPRGYLTQAEMHLTEPLDRKAIEEALTEAETRAHRGAMGLYLAEAWLLRSRLAVALAELEEARKWYECAKQLIEKHEYGQRLPDLAVLWCEIDPCLDNFQIACQKVGLDEQGDGGWWHLMPRLEALTAKQGLLARGKWNKVLEPLRKAEANYHKERDAYLAEIEKEREDGIAEAFEHFGADWVQQIAKGNNFPLNWKEWPDQVKGEVLEMYLKE